MSPPTFALFLSLSPSVEALPVFSMGTEQVFCIATALQYIVHTRYNQQLQASLSG